MKKKIIVLVVIGVLVLVLGVGSYFWYSMNQPLYEVGMVRSQKNLRALLKPAVPDTQAGFWQVEEDIRLWHFSQGEGRNVLIIHGGPGAPTRQPWTGLEALAQQYRFNYYDQRGCGKSTRPIERFVSKNMYQNMLELDRTLGLGAQIADIERLRQALGEEKLILIGHSWGGFLAALYAAEFPEHVQALVLVSPANMLVMPQTGDDLFSSVRARLPQNQQAEFEAFMQAYLNFGDLFQKSEADLVAMNQRFATYYRQVYPYSLPEQGEAGGWMVWGMYVSMGTRHDYRPALRQVDIPVLVLHGSDDLQSEAATRQYLQVFPQAEFAILQKAGHFSFYEQPEQFAATLADFLSKIKE